METGRFTKCYALGSYLSRNNSPDCSARHSPRLQFLVHKRALRPFKNTESPQLADLLITENKQRIYFTKILCFYMLIFIEILSSPET